MFFDSTLNLASRQGYIRIVIGHDHAGDFFAYSVRQSYNTEFFDKGMVGIGFFDLVGIYIFSVSVDDDFLRTPNKIKIPLVVEFAKISGFQPSIVQHTSSGGFITEIAEHDIRPARDNLSHTCRVGFRNPNLYAWQRPAHAAFYQ